MSLFKASENRANSENMYDMVMKEYTALTAPKEKLRYLLDLKESANNDVVKLARLRGFFLKNRGRGFDSWLRSEIQIQIQKDKIDSSRYFKDDPDSKKKEFKNSDELSEKELRKYVEERWYKLINEGYSENKAAKQIEKEIKKQRSSSTIKKWMHPEYL